jgi:hypothetical protein
MNFVVPGRKIFDYLLKDPGKSAFFSSIGYASADWERLRDDIRSMAERFSPAMRTRQVTIYGTEYEILGELAAPDGRTLPLTSAWIVDAGETDIIRFVTAYPAKR